MLFAVAIVSTRRTEPKVIHAYTRTHTPCIYMQRVAVHVALASCRVLRASYLPLAKGNKLNPVEAVDARGCAVGGSTTYAAITITTSTITTIATNKAPRAAPPTPAPRSHCRCLSAVPRVLIAWLPMPKAVGDGRWAMGDGRAWLHENAMCLK